MAETPLRDVAAGSLRAGDDGREVKVAGWVGSRRDHGGIIFLDVRDASGVVQVVIDPEATPELAEIGHRVRLEYCIAVAGSVRLRPDDTANPEMATGEVEIVAAGLTILSPAEPLPFQIDDRIDVDEAKRLEYRYLDLRRPRMAANLRARSAAIGAIRRSMDNQGFLEIETPTLIRSTPEGARDFLVPSRLRPGTFYALPQSPQLFKQLLMIAGVERYYQIARCYRDEDFRADRQIEFTQLDVEGAFWRRDDVMASIEEAIVAAVAAVRSEAPSLPFARMTWREAVDRFGTDKPDLRFGMEIEEISELFAATEFKAFAGALDAGAVVRGLNAGKLALARANLDGLVGRAQELGAKGLVWMVVENDGSLRSPVAKFFSTEERDGLVTALGAGPGDLLLLAADLPQVAAEVLGQLRVELGQPDGHGDLSFVWIVDFPVFEQDEQGDLVPSHHPFTAPVDVDEMAADPANAVSQAYDLVVNGTELGSGSVRIHDPETQARVFAILGISDEEADRRFGWFIEALRYGTPPHAGFAVGIDRLVAVLVEEASIRDVIPFPKTQTGMDPMTASPDVVDETQLAELGIALRPEVREALEAEEEK